MTALEAIFIWTGIGFYCASFLLFLAGLVFDRPRLPRYGFWSCVAGFVFHSGAILARWEATGHIPVMQAYENSLLGGWFVILTYIILRYAFPRSGLFGVAIVPLVVLVLGNGIQIGEPLQPLEPPYKSYWLYVHVLFGWFTFGAYVIAFAAGWMYELKDRAKKRGVLTRLPDLKLLDELSFRLILFGFFAESIMIGSGAIWAHGLWGRYWAWDPVETWSLVSWLTYGLNVHLRVTMGWRGRRAAWLAIFSLFGVICLFFGIGYVSDVHTGIF